MLEQKKRKVFFSTALGYDSKVVQFQEGMSEMPRLKIIQVVYVFLHLDVLINVIVIFRT